MLAWCASWRSAQIGHRRVPALAREPRRHLIVPERVLSVIVSRRHGGADAALPTCEFCLRGETWCQRAAGAPPATRYARSCRKPWLLVLAALRAADVRGKDRPGTLAGGRSRCGCAAGSGST